MKDIIEVDKLIYLLKISGTVEDLKRGIRDKRELTKLGGLRNFDKLSKAIDYFDKLRTCCNFMKLTDKKKES